MFVRVLVLMLLSLVPFSVLVAQERARGELFAGYSYADADLGSGSKSGLHGYELSSDFDPLHWLGVPLTPAGTLDLRLFRSVSEEAQTRVLRLDPRYFHTFILSAVGFVSQGKWGASSPSLEPCLAWRCWRRAPLVAVNRRDRSRSPMAAASMCIYRSEGLVGALKATFSKHASFTGPRMIFVSRPGC